MKKLILILLCLCTIFVLGCDGRDFSKMSDGEILGSLKQKDFIGKWVLVGKQEQTMTLYSDKSAKFEGREATWSYTDKRIRVQTEDESAFFYEPNVKGTKIRLYTGDGGVFIRGENVQEITLTAVNIMEYFEIRQIESWNIKDSEKWYNKEYVISLKEEYADSCADGIELLVEYKKNYYDYQADWENRKITLTQKDESYEETAVSSKGTVADTSLVIHTSSIKDGEQYSYSEAENIKVTTCKGTLYAIKE